MVSEFLVISMNLTSGARSKIWVKGNTKRLNEGKIYCLKNSLNFIEFFKSMNFTELLVNVTEFFNLNNKVNFNSFETSTDRAS